jgi:hypothetical protein
MVVFADLARQHELPVDRPNQWLQWWLRPQRSDAAGPSATPDAEIEATVKSIVTEQCCMRPPQREKMTGEKKSDVSARKLSIIIHIG